MNKRLALTLSMSLLFAKMAVASQVEIVNVMLEPSANRWTFHVTLKHADTGWEHYADDWRIVNAKGHVLGNRKLWHPHVSEQPFTRSLADVLIPKKDNIIFVEAHDKVHGWSKQRVRIDMHKPKGDHYEIRSP